MTAFVDEKSYRKKVKETYDLIESTFDNIDPDNAEIELGQGTLAIVIPKGKIILSTQPSIQQLWLAVSSQGKAVHFNYDSDKSRWIDDKGQGLELFHYLSQVIEQSAGLKLKFS